MYITQTITTQVDDLLNRIGQKLQLDKTRREKAVSAYNSIADLLENDQDFFNRFRLEVYPHGSFRIDTTVKPYKGDEYDLDFIAHIGAKCSNYTPTEILDRLEKCLKANGTYKDMVERKNRCVRLNYQGDFHLDIQPGCPRNGFEDDNLKVPDRQSKSWMDSSPRAFANWFESIYLPMVLIERKYQGLYEQYRVLADKEPLPQAVPYSMKQPIQRAVQLIKRFRDVYFAEKDQPDLKPASIILTTLAGNHYDRQESEFEAIKAIIGGIYDELVLYENRFEVVNPVNPAERFTDKWEKEPQLRLAFTEFISDFYHGLEAIEEESGIGNKTSQIKKLFGSSITDEVLTEQAKYISALRSGSMLGVSNIGTLTTNRETTVSTIKRNTFFGD